MPRKRDTNPPKGTIMPISDVAHAPFVFYENAAAFGALNGVIGITLAAHRTLLQTDGTVVNDQVVVAYLQGSAQAARSLRQALDRALLLVAPTGEGKAN